jgi:uncharacterized protein (DUF305 family)
MKFIEKVKSVSKKEWAFVALGFVFGVAFISCVNMGNYRHNYKFDKYGEYNKKAGMMKKMHIMPDGMMMPNTDMGMEDMMDGMMMGLEGKTGDDFDKEFLSEMIVHHEGAVSMAEKVLKISKKPELLKLAKDIILAQNKEIEMMKTWQTSLFK